MATTLTLEQMKEFVRDHFEDFVNKQNAAVIRRNMRHRIFTTMMGRVENRPG